MLHVVLFVHVSNNGRCGCRLDIMVAAELGRPGLTVNSWCLAVIVLLLAHWGDSLTLAGHQGLRKEGHQRCRADGPYGVYVFVHTTISSSP